MLLALAAAVVVGCSGTEQEPPRPPATGPSPETPSPEAPSKVAEVELSPIDKAAYERFLQKHRGKVVLVDFWATWCLPCVKLLPHTAQLARDLGHDGLVVATVSLDEADQESAAKEVLKSKGLAAAANFIAKGAAPGELQSDPFEVFEIPGGSVPHFKLYDRQGKLLRTFDSDKETIDPEEIDKALEGLLGKR